MAEATIRPYEPSLRDRFAQFLMGDARPSPIRESLVHGLVGSRGLAGSNPSMGLLDMTPVGAAFGIQEAGRSYDEGDYISAGLQGGGAALGLASYDGGGDY